MKADPENTCHCSSETPVILQGPRPVSPLNCMQCKKPVSPASLDDAKVSVGLTSTINKWKQLYSALFTLWHDSVEYREWAKQQLLDETGSINLAGLQLAQQCNVKRKTYYWLFQDCSDKDYIEPQECPYCGASMEPILENDFKVCHDCMIAYPDKQTG